MSALALPRSNRGQTKWVDMLCKENPQGRGSAEH